MGTKSHLLLKVGKQRDTITITYYLAGLLTIRNKNLKINWQVKQG